MKAQAAMEFIATYGWMLIVLVSAVFVLIHYGILDMSKILPEKCISPSGLDCIDVASIYATDNVEFVIRNGLGHAIIINDQSVGNHPVMVGSGACSSTYQAVPDPGTGSAGDIWLSHAYNNIPAPALYSSGQTIEHGEMIKIRVQCPNDIVEKQRFKDQFEIYYTNPDTNLESRFEVMIQGQVD